MIVRRLLLAAALLALTVTTPLANSAEPVRLRVMTYNIHHGEGTDGKLDLARIAGVIKAARPDLVALQEVDQNTRRTGGVDQAAELARLTGLHVAFGGNLKFEGGKYGNAVLSHAKIKHHENRPLPWSGAEQRGVMFVEIEGSSLLLLATHFDHRPSDQERRDAALAIKGWIRAHGDRLAILAGDLNDLPGSVTLKELATEWTDPLEKTLFTSPSSKPRRQIDYVLVRPASRFRLLEARVLDEPVASDHRPLIVDLEISDEASP